MDKEPLLPCQKRLVHQFRASLLGARLDEETKKYVLDLGPGVRGVDRAVVCISARWLGLLVENVANININTLVVVFPPVADNDERNRAMHAAALCGCVRLVDAGKIRTLVLSCMNVINRELHVKDASGQRIANFFRPPTFSLFIVGGTLGEGAWDLVCALNPYSLNLANEIDMPLRICGLNSGLAKPPRHIRPVGGCEELAIDGGPLRFDAVTTWALIRAAGAAVRHIELRNCDVSNDAAVDNDDVDEKYISIPGTVTQLKVDNIDPPWHTLAFAKPSGILTLAVLTSNEAHGELDPVLMSSHLRKLPCLRDLILGPHESRDARPVSLAMLAGIRNACPSLKKINCEFRVRTDSVSSLFLADGKFNVSLVADAQFHLTTALTDLGATNMAVYVRHAGTHLSMDPSAISTWLARNGPESLKFFMSGAGYDTQLGESGGRIVEATHVKRVDASTAPLSHCGTCGSFILTNMRSGRYAIGCPGGHFACTACVRPLLDHVRADTPHVGDQAVFSVNVACKTCAVEHPISCASPHGPTGQGASEGFVSVRRVPGYRRPVQIPSTALVRPDPFSANRLIGAYVHGPLARILPLHLDRALIHLPPGSRDSRVAIMHSKIEGKEDESEWAVVSVTASLTDDGPVTVRYIDTHRLNRTPPLASLVAYRVAHLFNDQPPTWQRAPVVYVRMNRPGRGTPAANFGAALVAALYECQARAVPYGVSRHPLDTCVLEEKKLEAAFTMLASPNPERDLGAWVNTMLVHDPERRSSARTIMVSSKDDIWMTLPSVYRNPPPSVVPRTVSLYTPRTLYTSHFLSTVKQPVLAAAVYFAAGFVGRVVYTSQRVPDGDARIDESTLLQTLVASVRKGPHTTQQGKLLGGNKYPLSLATLGAAANALPEQLEELLPRLFDVLVESKVESAHDQREVSIECREVVENHAIMAPRSGNDRTTMCHTIDLPVDRPVTDPQNALRVTFAALEKRIHQPDRVHVRYTHHPDQRARVYHVRRYKTTRHGDPALVSDKPITVERNDGAHTLVAAIAVTESRLVTYVLYDDGYYHAWNEGRPDREWGVKSFSELRPVFQTAGIAFAYASMTDGPSEILFTDPVA